MSSRHGLPTAESHRSRRRARPRPRVAGGAIGTLALSTVLAPTSALASTGSLPVVGEASEAPDTTPTSVPVIDLDSTGLYRAAEATARTAQDLETDAASQEADRAAREEAAAFKKAEEKRKAEEARKAAAERAAEAAASRSSGRADLATASSPGTGSGVIGFLRAQLGKAYVMGATGPGAYDCSGLVQAAYRTVGVNLPRTSQAQSSAVTPVPLGSLQPGDLIFWGGQGSAYHVAVYVGGGKYIDAANPSKGVVEQNLNDWPPDFAGRV
ncbi:C40 family peptidase [Streptomyces sp. NPDC059637]|uniref:C40 family peptidase n=1 Tax=Streptomyces sp. NPDC059637 TaxID=3347752 RepID=UPI00367989FA